MTGPNTGLGHNSIVYILESQFNYILDALRVMRERGAGVVEVRAEAQERFNGKVQEAMKVHGLDDRRLRVLVHRPQRPQHDALAGLDMGLPPPHAALRPGALRAVARRRRPSRTRCPPPPEGGRAARRPVGRKVRPPG